MLKQQKTLLLFYYFTYFDKIIKLFHPCSCFSQVNNYINIEIQSNQITLKWL